MIGVRPLAIAAKTLAATWLLLGLACNGAGTSSTPAPAPGGSRPQPAIHKVQVNAEKAAQLEKQGARILGDYGTYKLVAVENDALENLRTAPDVEVRDEYNQLQLNAGIINTASAHGQSLRGMALPATGKQFHLVQFVGPIQPEWYRALEATGVQVVTYIPNNAYLVYGDASTLSAMQRLTTGSQAIQWDGPYLNDYKLDPSINTVETAAYAIQLIKDDAANRETLGQVRSLQSREGVVQEALGYVNVNAYLDRAALYQLAMRPDVVSIQPSPEVKKLDERQNIIMIGSLNGNVPSGPGYMAWLASKGFTQAQFTASGFGVDVSDSGVDNATPATPNHFGLYDSGNVLGSSRLVYARLEGTPNASSTIQGCDGHGTINAHIIGGFSNSAAGVFGDGTGYSTGLGMAPFVKVGSSVVFDPNTFTSPNFESLQARAYRDGMRISSNSWGAASNTYSASSQRHDALVRDAQPAASAVPVAGNQEMVIVFAAGNSGAGANTVGNPGTAKNIITAGASENVRAFAGADGCGIADIGADSANDIISFSSRGPTSDGRKKPDIVAPGTHISGGVAQAAGQRADPPANAAGQALSCFNGEGVCGGVGSNFYPAGQQWYTSSSGTSHSTPAIAGAAALVRQYFINQGMNVPSAAMTKAYLMNSARYMTGTGANDNLWSNSQGMGSVDLGMAFDGTPRLLDDQTAPNLFTASGQTRTFTGSIADSGKPFRVTLAWTDAPGSTTGNAYNNNLDLVVTIGGNTYRGNVFTGRSSVTGGTADVANNVESVFLPAGQTGTFTITVTATNINSDGVPNVGGALDQDFALIAYNSCDNAPTTPTGTAATVTGDNQIEVAWTTTDASSYNIYRATVAGGPYTRIASATASPYVDTTVSGGTTYYYVVRGVLCAESANSNEASATATGACTLPPSFAGVATAASAGQSTCGNTLSWANGSPACGGTLSYSVYRSTTSGFTPSVANRIATGISGTSFLDNLNVSQGTTYYYVVRATEAGEAISEETNTVQRSASPTGAVSPGARYFDDFDGNRPPSASAYWIASTISGTAGTVNLTSGCRFQSSNTSYRVMGSASTSCAGTYPVSTQARLVLGGNGSTAGINGFAIPASATTPQLTFNLWYDIENSYDGVYLNYSTSSATGPWTRVGDATSATQPFISAGGYDGTLNSNTSIRIWTGRTAGLGTNGALKPVTVNLAGAKGSTVWFAFQTYTDSIVNYEGFYVDDVRVNADIVASCTTNVPPPGPAVAFRVNGFPATATAGTPARFTVTALDAVGQTATSYAGPVTFTSSDARAVLPTDATFNAGVADGVEITFGTTNAQTVTVRDAADPSITGTGGTNVVSGPPTRLSFRTQPTNTMAGSSIAAVQVSLADVYGNPATTGSVAITVALDNNPGGSTLTGTTTVTSAGGTATFSDLKLNKVGQGYTLTASATGLTGATSAPFNITPGAPAKLILSVQPSTVSAGMAISPAPRVTVLDANDNLTNAAVPVVATLSTNPSGSTLAGSTTASTVNGVASFGNLWLDKVGQGYKLTFGSAGLTAVVSDEFAVTPGAPYRVRFTQQPSDITAGSRITPPVQVTVYDRYANVATQTDAPVTVHLGSNSAGGTLGGTTSVLPTNGVASFADLSVNRKGRSYTLVAGSSGLFTDTSTAFDVRGADRLAFQVQPSSTRAGNAIGPSVEVSVQDAQGNTVSAATGSITVALGNNSAGGMLSGTATAVLVNGVASFSDLKVNRSQAGYTLNASYDGLSAASAAFDITTGPASRIAFVTSPSNTVAGNGLGSVQIAVTDSEGNVVTDANGDITVSLGGAQGTLNGTTTVTAVNGVADFADLSINQAAQGFTLTASTTGLDNASSGAFDVSHGPAAGLSYAVQPSSARAGAAISSAVKVAIVDAYGNVVTSSNDTIQVALDARGSGATLSGTASAAAVNGIATFADLSVNRPGAGYSLLASSGALSAIPSAAFDIMAGPPARLVFKLGPANTTAGTVIGPIEVELRDELGNPLTDATDSVTLVLGGANGTLGGTATVNAVNGIATFSTLNIQRAAVGYTLTARTTGLPDTTSSAFDVAAGDPVRLVFAVQPGVTQAGQRIGPTVRVAIEDAYGNIVTSAQDNITLALDSNATNGSLAGSTTAAAVNGVATFSDLVLARAGASYTLKATTGSLPAAISSAFDVTVGPPARLVIKAGPATTRAGTSVGPVQVELQDEYGNVRTNGAADVTVSIGANPTGAGLVGTGTARTQNGIASIDGLTLHKAGTGYTLVASASGYASATSEAFDINPGPAASYQLALPASVTAGQEVTLSATAYDAYGNLASAYAGAAKVTASDSVARLPADKAFVAGKLSDVKVTFRTAGLAMVTLTDVERTTLAQSAQTNVTPFAQPVVAITDPAGGTTVSGSVSITATGAVAQGTTVRDITLLVDGVVIATGTEGTVTGTWDSSKAANGSQHTITAVISDAAGNVANSAPVGIIAKNGSCGCGATSGADASAVLALLALARYVAVRRRRQA